MQPPTGFPLTDRSTHLSIWQEAAEELHRLIKEEELQNSLLLVLANKQDLPGACNAAEIAEEMHLYPPYISKSCYIQSCCATSGEGLHEGLDWLSSNMPEENKAA